MANTPEDAVLNSLFKAFRGEQTKPSKSYMVIANSIPKVGERFKCKKLEKSSSNELCFRSTETSTVQKLEKLAGAENIYVVTTRNSYYITRILSKPTNANVYFAAIRQEPELGSHLKCYKMQCLRENVRFIQWETTTIREVKFIKGLYKVRTRNSIYVCFPM